MTPGWRRAETWWATVLAEALGIDPDERRPLAELVAIAGDQAAQLRQAAEPRLLTVAQAAERAWISPWTVHGWTRFHGLPAQVIAGTKYIDASDLAAWLAAQRPHLLSTGS